MRKWSERASRLSTYNTREVAEAKTKCPRGAQRETNAKGRGFVYKASLEADSRVERLLSKFPPIGATKTRLTYSSDQAAGSLYVDGRCASRISSKFRRPAPEMKMERAGQ